MRSVRAALLGVLLVLAAAFIVHRSRTALPGIPPPGADARPGYPVYRETCARCHGLGGLSERASRTAGEPVSLVDPAWRARISRDRIERIVREGKGKMEGLAGELTDEEIRLVVDYVLWMPVRREPAP